VQRNKGEPLAHAAEETVVPAAMSAATAKKAQAMVDKELCTVEAPNDDMQTLLAEADERAQALVALVKRVQAEDPSAKVLVVAAKDTGAHGAAKAALGAACSTVGDADSDPKALAAFRNVDATAAAKAMPRVLLLGFDQCAGHNLQSDCHRVVLFAPLFSSMDVEDVAKEQQAIGRVLREYQREKVQVFRLELTLPGGKAWADRAVIERNTDADVLRWTTDA
jgi:hypothetical protein